MTWRGAVSARRHTVELVDPRVVRHAEGQMHVVRRGPAVVDEPERPSATENVKAFSLRLLVRDPHADDR